QVTGAHGDDVLRPAIREPHQLDHRPDRARQVRQRGVNVGPVHGPDAGALRRVAPAALQRRYGRQRLDDRGRYQLDRHGPPGTPADAPDAVIDDRPAQPRADHLVLDGAQFERAEVPCQGRAVKLVDRAEGDTEIIQLAGGLAVRPAVVPGGEVAE